MSRKYRNYTDEDVLKAVAENKSAAGVLKQLGLVVAGGNYSNIYRTIQRLNADTSHWTGQGWNKDKQLKKWSDYTRVVNLKPHLINLRGVVCECCSNTEWLGQPITLELHHLDGDRTNNSVDNLQLLCPNCHSFTDSWRKPKSNKGTL